MSKKLKLPRHSSSPFFVHLSFICHYQCNYYYISHFIYISYFLFNFYHNFLNIAQWEIELGFFKLMLPAELCFFDRYSQTDTCLAFSIEVLVTVVLLWCWLWIIISVELLWVAPELLAGSERKTKSGDVYSYGIILAEIMTREDPYAELQMDPKGFTAHFWRNLTQFDKYWWGIGLQHHTGCVISSISKPRWWMWRDGNKCTVMHFHHSTCAR